MPSLISRKAVKSAFNRILNEEIVRRSLRVPLYFILMEISNFLSFYSFGSSVFFFVVSVFIISLSEKDSSNSLILYKSIIFGLLTATWGWLNPELSQIPSIFYQFILAILLSLNFGNLRVDTKSESTLRERGLRTGFWTLVILAPLLFSDRLALKVLLWGYDNAAHLPAFHQVFEHKGFVFSGSIDFFKTFANYQNSYPPLQSASWAFLTSVITPNIDQSEFLRAYFFFYCLSGTLTIFLVLKLIRNMRKFPEINLGLEMIIIFIVTFSAYSNVFWSGYPSFQWGVIHFLIALLIIAKKEDSGATQMSFYFAACVLTFYSYQLIAVPLFVSLFYFFIKLKKIEIIQLFSRPLNLYMNVATLVLLISFIEKTINVRTIVLNTGGIETISLSLLICGVIFLHLGILGVDQMLSSFKNLIVVLYCSIACSVGLSLYAIRSTGSPTYYTQKFNYLLLLLLMILSLIIIFWPSRRKTTIKKKLHNFSSLFLVLCVWVTFSNRAFSTAFMGGSLQVLQTSIMEHRGLYMNRGANCLITYFSEFYIRDRNPRHARIFLPSQKISGDIESRWLNALDLRLNEPLYELFIPLGQAKEGIERVRVIEDWQAKHPNYSIEFYSDNSIDESLNSKFKSTRINC